MPRRTRIVDGRLTEQPVMRRPSIAAVRSLRDLVGGGGRRACSRGPGRVALTVLGTVIGVAALVATLGLSKTASNQIEGRFDAVAATDIVVSPAPPPRRDGRPACSRSAPRRASSGSTGSSPPAAWPTSTCAGTS